ncbi:MULTISPECIES: bifunctional DNA-formamidopyrimidine glycosylase/DNA-(apurinic or apyrimidinic site) lyase [Rhodomicrobium]|uniref:bifunctional DNA-formamidopyrimidine glycosylase/DNA-(apurinic or apyrimidinic site) lyase n=1 Tax=Rhodomicrobium TaxID=1068 RepID=UPI000B4C13FE|nr:MULTISPECIES: bifunctional DNA-formamidopyrimidine glycosylase/DNA-(apurinic or apyrimidinic site) lyase [Rhodomicrobium]
MPELPEVETVRRGLAPVLEGASFARVEQRRADLRFPLPANFAKRLEGRRVEHLTRRAKYLLAELDDGQILTMHLGMTGRFLIGGLVKTEAGGNAVVGDFLHETGGDDKHDHVIFEMSNLAVIRYNDARRFGYMALLAPGEIETHPHFRDLGLEPLGPEMNPVFLAAKAKGRKTPLKAFLLDQHVIAGLGNIYVCEALYRAKLLPDRPASILTLASGAPSAAAKRLAPAIRATLEDAIEAGGSSLRDYRQADGSLGYFQHRFCVYGREGEPCLRAGCKGIIARKVQSGRSTFFCPVCQT